MSTITKYFCDLCGKEKKYDEISMLNISPTMNSAQRKYFYKSFQFCDECSDKLEFKLPKNKKEEQPKPVSEEVYEILKKLFSMLLQEER